MNSSSAEFARRVVKVDNSQLLLVTLNFFNIFSVYRHDLRVCFRRHVFSRFNDWITSLWNPSEVFPNGACK